MKKKLLFVIDSLDCAGAEKSLVTLLGLLDYSKYDVDLVLFAHGKTLQSLVPDEVTIIEPFPYTIFTTQPLAHSLKTVWRQPHFLWSRLSYSLKLRSGEHDNIKKARLYWESASRAIKELPNTYDTAIAYAQGVPTFFVSDKVKARQKYAWVNVSYRLTGKEKTFQRKHYDQFNKIVAVSAMTKDIFLENYPDICEKMTVIHDINNPEMISQMAELDGGYSDEFTGLRLLTIGRLARQKGYDMALEACKKLKENGIHFKWYVLGKGPLQEEIEAAIKEYKLEEHFILLGVKANPYPYIKQADLYVQTSRFEGFGIALAEARMLNTPVVTTRFDAVFTQMVDGKNGLVVDMGSDAIFKGIMTLIQDEQLTEAIKEYQSQEKKGNIEEIEKVYALIHA
jgi:glycosyltransferase involved in cell wall biosynthesis